jgi:hypothetical protein
LIHLQSIVPKDSMWRNGLGSELLMFLVLGPALALGYWGGKAIKKHITWPRTGYVAYRRDGAAWWRRYVVPLVVGGVVAAGFELLVRRPEMMSVTRVVYLAVFVGAYGVFVQRSECWWKWLVLLVAGLGLLTIGVSVPGDVEELAQPVMWFLGLVWLGSGGATLYWYILHTEPAVPGAE